MNEILTRRLVGLFATIYVAVRLPYFLAPHAAADFAPIGIVLFRVPAPVHWGLTLGAIVAGGFYVWRPNLVFPVLFLWITSYASSWGKILHSENLLAVHLFVLALPWGDRLRLAALATTLTYFVAGVSKLRVGGVAWLTGDALGAWLRWDALRKIELGSFASPVAAWVAARPAVVQTMAIYTLVVELGAPFALLSRRTTYTWVVAAWAFHAGILATMAIGFFYPLSGVAFAAMLPLERCGPLRRLGAR